MPSAAKRLTTSEPSSIDDVRALEAPPRLPAEAIALATQINGWSSQGIALTKRMMWAGLETSSLRAAIELESHTQLFVRMTTKNFEEAVQARKENRPPRFED